jgi:hypothetical protein
MPKALEQCAIFQVWIDVTNHSNASVAVVADAMTHHYRLQKQTHRAQQTGRGRQL